MREPRYCADALVFVQVGDQRWVLLGERDRIDTPGWGTPGGKLEPGEDALTAAVRELREETGLVLDSGFGWTVAEPRVVPDPRPGQWITHVCSVDLIADALPPVEGRDGTRRADWFRAESFDQMANDLRARYGGRLFEAHIGMLIDHVNASWKGHEDVDRT